MHLVLLLAIAGAWQGQTLAVRETQAALGSYAEARAVAVHCACAADAVELGDDLAAAARREPSRDAARWLYGVVAHIVITAYAVSGA